MILGSIVLMVHGITGRFDETRGMPHDKYAVLMVCHPWWSSRYKPGRTRKQASVGMACPD